MLRMAHGLPPDSNREILVAIDGFPCFLVSHAVSDGILGSGSYRHWNGVLYSNE